MARKITKLLTLGVAIIMAFSLGACGNGALPYNATFFDAKDATLRDDFRLENRLKGMVIDLDDKGEPIFADESYPISRTFVVKEQIKYELIYTRYSLEMIDFENEILLLYTFMCSNTNRKIEIKSISFEGEVLYVNWAKEKGKSGYGDASQPRQRWIAIKMDLLNITAVEFKERRLISEWQEKLQNF